jgi:cytochrome c oxidase assembly protein subunit 11
MRVTSSASPKALRTTLVACVALGVGMVGLAYASVPLYRLFCQVTGFGGTTQRAEEASATVTDRLIKIRFDTNIAAGLKWKFTPEIPVMSVKVGETATGFFKITNLASEAVTGRAAYNVEPALVGSYFNKLQCFCFEDLTLKAGESLDVPVVFFVDPAVAEQHDLDSMTEITLSYTFFASKTAPKPVAELTGTPKPQL